MYGPEPIWMQSVVPQIKMYYDTPSVNGGGSASGSSTGSTGETSNDDKDIELTPGQRRCMEQDLLNIDTNEKYGTDPTLGLVGDTALFTAPSIYNAGRRTIASYKSDATIDMFYGQNGSKVTDLYRRNPNLMSEAQEAMHKIEKRYAKDIAAAGKNEELVKTIEKERDLMRKAMQEALAKGDMNTISKVSQRAQAEGGGWINKNGWWKRTFRRFRGKEIIKSRSVSGTTFTPKVPKSGTKFLHNAKGSVGVGALMVGISLLTEKGKIKEAYNIDKKTGRKQLEQTTCKAALSIGAWTAADAAGKMLIKKAFGKLAAKAVTKIAMKGGCKLLGSAIGSAIPGLGTVVGLALGCLIDIALEKWVYPKIFKNDVVTVAQTQKASDEELLNNLENKYTSGQNLSDVSMAVLKKNRTEQQMDSLKTLHSMSEADREALRVKEQENALAQAQSGQFLNVPA